MMKKSIIKRFEQNAGIKLHPGSRRENGEREDIMLIGERFYVIDDVIDDSALMKNDQIAYERA